MLLTTHTKHIQGKYFPDVLYTEKSAQRANYRNIPDLTPCISIEVIT